MKHNHWKQSVCHIWFLLHSICSIDHGDILSWGMWFGRQKHDSNGRGASNNHIYSSFILPLLLLGRCEWVQIDDAVRKVRTRLGQDKSDDTFFWAICLYCMSLATWNSTSPDFLATNRITIPMNALFDNYLCNSISFFILLKRELISSNHCGNALTIHLAPSPCTNLNVSNNFLYFVFGAI